MCLYSLQKRNFQPVSSYNNEFGSQEGQTPLELAAQPALGQEFPNAPMLFKQAVSLR